MIINKKENLSSCLDIYTAMYLMPKVGHSLQWHTKMHMSFMYIYIFIYIYTNTYIYIHAQIYYKCHRMEVFKLKSISGLMKMIGITFCVAGIIIIAFYTGAPLMRSMKHHPVSNHQPKHSPSTWIKGSFLMITANIFWSLWLTSQVIIK